MKNLILSILVITFAITSCEKGAFEQKKEIKEIVNVEVQTKDLSNFKHAVFTTLEDGKLVIFFSKTDLKKYYDINIDKKKSGINFPDQIFYIGVYPATEGNFPNLAQYKLGSINYTKIKLNPDFSLSLSATQKYMATHIIIDATTPPMELGKYEINIDYLVKDSIISGNFNGIMAKINLETQKPDISATPLLTQGDFENVEYIDIEKVKEWLPFDISNVF